MSSIRGKGKAPWKPSGASLFNRTLGFGYGGVTTSAKGGAASGLWTGRGRPAGVFKKGDFRLGR